MFSRSVLILLIALSTSALSQTNSSAPPQKIPTVEQTVEVTTTRVEEDPEGVPASVEVITGDDLRARGAGDLRSALQNAIGVDIAPGGDAGPASSVPEFWGLKELDAFLLVVDGVPWGGAFNPALTALNLNDVERIEVVRGPAPVTFGATSFVGVIHVVNKDVTSPDRTLVLHGGSFGSGGASLVTPVPLGGDWASRLTVEGERMGFADDRTAYRRGHGLWRVSRAPQKGSEGPRLWINLDLNWLDQDPASPRVRDGVTFSPLLVVDANFNPANGFLNDRRGTISGGFARKVGGAEWSTNVSFSHSRQEIFRGFLRDITDTPDNAHGFREQIHLWDSYADSHFTGRLTKSLRYLAGGDFLHGTGAAKGADFDYTVPLTGAPVNLPEPGVLDVTIDDHRDFFGVYGSLQWVPLERVRIDGGVRVNATRESRTDADPGAGTVDSDKRNAARVGASVGAIVTAWQHDQDTVSLFANYRDTFKPAAIDFGIGEGFAGDLILEPETSRSIEGGLKTRLFNRRMEAEVSGFLMDFTNLVMSTNIGGNPALVNGGKDRFKGFESGVSAYLPHSLVANATYSFHDSRFTDLIQDFGGVPTQLAGNRLEMVPNHLAAFGLRYIPPHGLLAGLGVNYRGSVFLDKRNTAPASGFATVDANAGYRWEKWELRVDGHNLGDRRDAVAESELGDAQYYLLPSRRIDATFRIHF